MFLVLVASLFVLNQAFHRRLSLSNCSSNSIKRYWVSDVDTDGTMERPFSSGEYYSNDGQRFDLILDAIRFPMGVFNVDLRHWQVLAFVLNNSMDIKSDCVLVCAMVKTKEFMIKYPESAPSDFYWVSKPELQLCLRINRITVNTSLPRSHDCVVET